MNIYTNALIILYGNLILATLQTNKLGTLGFLTLAAITLISALIAENK